MAARRRSEGLELNFDGLTDSVTNLVGALILLVVLILGVTQEAISQPLPTPPKQKGKQSAGEKPISPLESRIVSLEKQIRKADVDVKTLQDKLQDIDRKFKSLLEEAQKLKIPDRAKPKPEPKKPPEVVKFRLPLAKKSSKKTNVGFICEDGRVSIVVFEKLSLQAQKQLLSGKLLTFKEGDFTKI